MISSATNHANADAVQMHHHRSTMSSEQALPIPSQWPEPVARASQTRRGRTPAVTSLLSLPVLAGFALFSSPARAVPAASMQLFRLDHRGMQPVPALAHALASSAQLSAPGRISASTQTDAGLSADQPLRSDPAAGSDRSSASPSFVRGTGAGSASAPLNIAIAASPAATGRSGAAAGLRGASGPLLLAQSGTGTNNTQVLEVEPDGTVKTNPSGDAVSSEFGSNQLTLDFNEALPTDMQGPIRLRIINSDGTLGSLQQEISNYSVQLNGKQVILRPSSSIPAGQNFVLEFPSTCGSGTCVYPGQPLGEPLYVGFNSPEAIAPFSATASGAAATGAAATGAAAVGASFPVWAIVLGVVVVGVGVAAASGAFSSGGGGGGTSPSSQ